MANSIDMIFELMPFQWIMVQDQCSKCFGNILFARTKKKSSRNSVIVILFARTHSTNHGKKIEIEKDGVNEMELKKNHEEVQSRYSILCSPFSVFNRVQCTCYLEKNRFWRFRYHAIKKIIDDFSTFNITTIFISFILFYWFIPHFAFITNQIWMNK